MDELDLEKGDAKAAEKLAAEGSAARTRRRSTSGTGSKSGTRKTTAAVEAEEKTLLAKVTEAFKDLADQFQERDPELADVLMRRKDAMAVGLISFTRTFKWLRGPLVFLVSFLQPVFGFWELGGLLTRRYIARRQRLAFERQTGQSVEDAALAEAARQGSHGYA